jgi:hypothetical protein
MTSNSQILEKVISLIKENGHRCINIETNGRLTWCQLDDCPSTKSWAEMDKKNKEMEDLANVLKEAGHTCVTFLKVHPGRIKWCQQKTCTSQK